MGLQGTLKLFQIRFIQVHLVVKLFMFLFGLWYFSVWIYTDAQQLVFFITRTTEYKLKIATFKLVSYFLINLFNWQLMKDQLQSV